MTQPVQITQGDVRWAYETLRQWRTMAFDGDVTLAVAIDTLFEVLGPTARPIVRAFEAIQRRHQTIANGKPIFSATGAPIFTDPLGFRDAVDALEDAPLGQSVPSVTPIATTSFPADFPWVPRALTALRRIGYLTTPTKEAK